MQRLMVIGASLVLGTIATYVLFEFTPVDIPFFDGGVFTVMSVLLVAVFFSIVMDTILAAGVHDERGWHPGPVELMGPLGKDEPAPPADYQPIVSRTERLKQQKKA